MPIEQIWYEAEKWTWGTYPRILMGLGFKVEPAGNLVAQQAAEHKLKMLRLLQLPILSCPPPTPETCSASSLNI